MRSLHSTGGWMRTTHTMTDYIGSCLDHIVNFSPDNAFQTFVDSSWSEFSNLVTPTIGWGTMAHAAVMQPDDDDDDVIVVGETGLQNSAILPEVREVSESELKITLKYRSMVVKCVDVNIRNGFRVSSDPSLRSDHRVLTFPEKQESFFGDCDTKMRSKIYTCTKKVLENLQDGVELSISDRAIYATRRCLAKLFCYSSQMHNGQNPVKLQRDEPVKIFDYNRFEESLKGFYIHQIDPDGIRTTFPKPKIFLSCAQTWKPLHDRDLILREMGDTVQPTPLSDCLVTIEIVPLRAVDFIMSLPECREVTESITMSMNSDHLQISN